MYLHCSAITIAAVLLVGALERPIVAAVAIIAFASVMLIHELGHAAAAHFRGCTVLSLYLYPIHGITLVEQPRTRYDEYVIAWGGFLAQAAVAIPLIAWVVVFGYTPSEAANAVLALLGFYNAVVAIFNILPIPPLDGSQAWRLIPLIIQRWRIASRSLFGAQRRKNSRLKAVK